MFNIEYIHDLITIVHSLSAMTALVHCRGEKKTEALTKLLKALPRMRLYPC